MGIKTDEDLNGLLALFDKKNKATVEEVKTEEEFLEGEDMENPSKSKQGKNLEIDTNEILSYLKEFLQEKKKRRDEQSNQQFIKLIFSSRKCTIKYIFKRRQ